MKSFLALCRVSLQGLLLSSSQHTKAGKKAASGIGILVLLAAVCLYISGVYSFLLAGAFADAGCLELVYTLMCTAAAAGSLLFCLFNAAGFVFGGKDTDFLLSLPVFDFTLVLSRVVALYIENLFFSFCFLAPAVAAVIWAGGPVASSLLLSIPVCLILPLLPSAAALLAAYFVSLFESRGKHRTVVRTIAYLAFFGLTIVGSMKLNLSLESALLDAGALMPAVRRTLGLFYLAADAIYLGDLSALFWFFVLSAVPFLLIVWVLARAFRPLVARLSGHSFSLNYKLAAQKSSGVFRALYKKELYRYLNSTIYLLNTSIGMLLAVIGCVAALINRQDVLFAAVSMGNLFFPLLVLSGGAMTVLSCVTAPSISLEGNRLWILKAAPISPCTLFDVKLALQFTVVLPALLLSAVLLAAGGFIGWGDALLFFVLCALACAVIGEAGLLSNLKFPKLDGANDTVIVKQSASVLVAMLAGAVLCGLTVLCYRLFCLFLPGLVSLWLLTIPLAVLFLLCRHLLMHWGVKRFAALL